MNAPCRDCPERCIGCRRSCRRWKAYQLTLKIIKARAKKHCYLDPMPDSRTNEVKNRTKNTKASASEVNVMLTLPIKRKWFDMICRGEKREEYREPTDYWKERLFRARGRASENEIPDPFHLKIFPIQIRAGYRQDSPTACLMVTIQFGKYGVPEWGADPDKEYIIIRILSVEDIHNWKASETDGR